MKSTSNNYSRHSRVHWGRTDVNVLHVCSQPDFLKQKLHKHISTSSLLSLSEASNFLKLMSIIVRFLKQGFPSLCLHIDSLPRWTFVFYAKKCYVSVIDLRFDIKTCFLCFMVPAIAPDTVCLSFAVWKRVALVHWHKSTPLFIKGWILFVPIPLWKEVLSLPFWWPPKPS